MQQGMGAYSMTLPIAWIRKNGFENKKELEVEEVPEGLLITAEPQKKEKKITLLINEEKISRIRTIISSAYRRGYNTIVIQSELDLSFQKIEQVVNSFFGLVVLEQKKKEVVIKNMLEIDPRATASIIQKFFTTILVLQEEVIKKIEGKTNENISVIHSSVLKLRDYAQLVVSETSFQEERSYEYYTVIFLSEKIAASFYELTAIKRKWSKKEIENIITMSALFRELQSALLSNTLSKAIKINTTLSEIRRKGVTDTAIPASMHVISEYMFGLSSRIVSILL